MEAEPKNEPYLALFAGSLLVVAGVGANLANDPSQSEVLLDAIGIGFAAVAIIALVQAIRQNRHPQAE